MIKIAHRGNVNGPSIHENQLWYIQKAIDLGYEAEIDVWIIRGKLWSGHNSAQYLLDMEFIIKNKNRLWIHCKNFEALDYFATVWGRDLKYFWHQEDDYTITNTGHIWTYPEKNISKRSIIVDLEGKTEYTCYGICSDYLE